MEASVGEVVERLSSAEFARVVGHADADGVSSAACVCAALASLGVPYHFTAVEEPSDAPDSAADDALTVFCDLGAAYLGALPEDAVVVDHHPAHGDGDALVVGTGAPSSSVVAYRVAREAGVGDARTAFAALVGAVGDGVLGSVDEVRDEAVELGAEDTEGALLAGANPTEALAYATAPYTRLSGEYEGARDFIESHGIEGFGPEFSTAVVLLALTNDAARPDAVEGLVGDSVALDGARLHNVAPQVEACAKTGKHGLAFSLCARPRDDDEARAAWRAYASDTVERVREARIEEGQPATARVPDGDPSPVADTLYDWVTGDVVVVNTAGEASLRASGFDCGRVAREAAEETGGEGGGHPDRAGATFDAPAEAFLRAVRGAV